jgi:Zn-dependent peptidase ImmA (M78 family)
VETQSRSAEKIVKQLGFTSLPIDPFLIAEKKEISVMGKPLDGCNGCLMLHDDQFGIIYSESINNKGFINFTVGHELGHYYIEGHPKLLFPQGNGIHKSQSGFISNDKLEREADYFSVGLLMPKQLFRPAMNKVGLGLQAIKELSKLCGTSLTATSIRFANLAEYPTAIIVSSDNNIEYCVLSEDLREVCNPWNLKGREVPSSSTSSGHYRSPAKAQQEFEVEGSCQLADWFDEAPDIEVSEDVIGLGNYGKVLTILYSDSIIEDVEDEDDTPSF